jgi:hypothetical protein
MWDRCIGYRYVFITEQGIEQSYVCGMQATEV